MSMKQYGDDDQGKECVRTYEHLFFSLFYNNKKHENAILKLFKLTGLQIITDLKGLEKVLTRRE